MSGHDLGNRGKWHFKLPNNKTCVGSKTLNPREGSINQYIKTSVHGKNANLFIYLFFATKFY